MLCFSPLSYTRVSSVPMFCSCGFNLVACAPSAAIVWLAAAADGPVSLEVVLPQHDKLINLYNEARAATRSAVKAAQTGAAAGSSSAAAKAGEAGASGTQEVQSAWQRYLQRLVCLAVWCAAGGVQLSLVCAAVVGAVAAQKSWLKGRSAAQLAASCVAAVLVSQRA